MSRIAILFTAVALAAGEFAYAQEPGPSPSEPSAQAPLGRAPRPHDRPHRPDAAFQRADSNQDGKVSFEELRGVRPGMTRERFSQLDSDGDGFLTPSDRPRQRGGRDLAESQRAFVNKLMESDANRDGKVTFEELSQSKPGFPKDAFARMDSDNDGALTRQDLQQRQVRGERPQRPDNHTRAEGPGARPRPERRQRMDKADTNGDGKISMEEAQAVMPGMTAERFNSMDRDGDGFLTRADRPPRTRP